MFQLQAQNMLQIRTKYFTILSTGISRGRQDENRERQTDTHGRTDRADKQTMQINKTHSVKELHLEKIKDRNGDRNPHRVYI